MAPISYNGLFEVSLFSHVDFISNKNDCRINEMKNQENLLVISSLTAHLTEGKQTPK